MSTASRKRQRASRFVLCPVGCLQHIAEKDINRHIDQCLQQQEGNKIATAKDAFSDDLNGSYGQGVVTNEFAPQTPPKSNQCTDHAVTSIESIAVVSQEKQFQVAQSSASSKNLLTNSPSPQLASPVIASQSQWNDNADGNATNEHPSVDNESKDKEPSPQAECNQERTSICTAKSPLEKKNAFARMMSQSKVLFSSKRKSPKEQCFHLHENGTVSIFPSATSSLPTAWHTTITIKDRSMSQDGAPTEFSITLSSSLPNGDKSADTPLPRWVQHHSRLSVPVLKSILQKSIRRRRPLPSVKVAMELADKSLGELLRRLPIIILEDSTLHPDFDLLVWLMMAHSKDYTIPPSILARVFEIIFEICMCPWIDSCSYTVLGDTERDLDRCSVTSLTSLHEELITNNESVGGLSLIWAMLIRAEYGGMKGDVEMLRSFASVWKNRLQSKVYCSTLGILWAHVPSKIHERARDQAHQRVSELWQNTSRLRCLTLKDISTHGIDFHCSSIIDNLLSDEPFRELCYDLLKMNGTQDSYQTLLPSLLKRCLWDFSAGINRRQPLEGGPQVTQSELQYLWNELIASRANAFQTAYVEQRLAVS